MKKSGENNMNKQKLDIKKIINIAGAFIAFLTGSGFATGQEVLQYFSSYGYWGVMGATTALFLLLYVGISFTTIGQQKKFKKGSDVFKYYCGNRLGNFFDYFSIIFMYLSFIVMLSGASATFSQHFSLPIFVGGSVMAVLTCITVLLGLDKLVTIIGKIGPFIVIISISLGLVTIFNNLDGLSKSNELLPTITLTKASTNWFFASCSYVGFCMLWLAGFLSSIGATANSNKEAAYGAAYGALGFASAVIIIALALLSCIEDVAGSQIPLLILAGKIHPLLATIFSLIIVTGIYTAAVPLLWSVSSRFANDQSTKFKTLSIILGIIGFIISIILPYSKLINIIYVINGYVGILLLVLMFAKNIRNMMKGKESVRDEIVQK
jgi:uncharacterized membrane protein YkvI